jgi:hypothetical protein
MKWVGNHGSSSLLIVKKVDVWHFVSNSHKDMSASFWSFSLIISQTYIVWQLSTLNTWNSKVVKLSPVKTWLFRFEVYVKDYCGAKSWRCFVEWLYLSMFKATNKGSPKYFNYLFLVRSLVNGNNQQRTNQNGFFLIVFFSVFSIVLISSTTQFLFLSLIYSTNVHVVE